MVLFQNSPTHLARCSNMAIFDLSGDRVLFDKAQWIGCGKRFPEFPPANLQQYCETLLTIPAKEERALLPNPELSVTELLKCVLPTTSSTLVNVSAKACFSMCLPTEDIPSLLTRNVPNINFVKDAEDHVRQAILDGANSFIDPNYKGAAFPLWVITYWVKMGQAIRGQNIWRSADRWLTKHTDQSARRGAINECQELLTTLGWQVAIKAPGGGDTTTKFACLLCDVMVNGTVVDMMMQNIADRVMLDEACA